MREADRDAAGELWAMAGLATPMAVRAMATLRIADRLSGGGRTGSELAAATGAHPAALERLLRFLARRRLLHRNANGRYTLTGLGAVLREDHPAQLRGWLDIDGAGRAELAFVHLLHSIRTGEAGFPQLFGRTLWDDLSADPQRSASFRSLMGDITRTHADQIAASYDWGSLGHVVDLGGGDGALLVALLTTHPALRGTLVDLPGAAAVARRTLLAHRLTDRSEVVAGSFFGPLPSNAGGYLLSLVVHNWPDSSARALLRHCAAAAGPGGKVLVVERISVQGDTHTGMDLRMLVYAGGTERGVGQLRSLAASAGLRTAGVYPAAELVILELVVAGDEAGEEANEEAGDGGS